VRPRRPPTGRLKVTTADEHAATATVTDELTELARQMSELARMMSEGLEQGLHAERVLHYAAAAVPGADQAGLLTLQARGEPVLVASTGPLVAQVEAVQSEVREGPALEALTISDIVYVPDLAESVDYPLFGPAAIDATGVRSLLSYRLYLTAERTGALNFYSTTPDAFSDLAIPLGAIFAAYASLTLINALHGDRVMHLERALESNREIGVAIGILMARDLHTQEQAFGRLRSASQNLHRKLRDVAAEVRLTGRLPE
jgi:ANTAR domain